jgi:hypothetical protein
MTTDEELKSLTDLIESYARIDRADEKPFFAGGNDARLSDILGRAIRFRIAKILLERDEVLHVLPDMIEDDARNRAVWNAAVREAARVAEEALGTPDGIIDLTDRIRRLEK